MHVDDRSNVGLGVEDAALLLTDPKMYADEELAHGALSTLRESSPLHLVEAPSYNPFWAVVRHAELTEVEKQNERFVNAPRPILQTAEEDRLRAERGSPMRSLVHMDEPDHGAYRALTQAWFQPRALRSLQSRIDSLAGQWTDRLADHEGECDFAADIAMHYPLHVILSILGLPEADFPRMLKLTQEMFGEQDPEIRRSESPEERRAVFDDFFAYFSEAIDERRRTPTDDLTSLIANAKLDGELISDMDAISYLILIATAGHDTTSASVSGGLLALIEHPTQLDRLRSEPDLVSSAVEEILRWVSPVKQFMRTAVEDCELGGKQIHEGDGVLLCYPAANRDERVFADAFAFDVARRPNPHRAFGFGVHACLGAQLARLELRALFAQLIPRLRHIELAGDPIRSRTLFVGGIRHLPIAYEVSAAR